MFTHPLERLRESLENNKRMLFVINEDTTGKHPIEFKLYVEKNIEQTEKAIKVLREYEQVLNFQKD